MPADIMERRKKKKPSILTNVRWQLPEDVMDKIAEHQKVLNVLEKREVSQEYAAIDLIRNRKLPTIIISHE